MFEILSFLLDHWALSGLLVCLFMYLMYLESENKLYGIVQFKPSELVSALNHQHAVLVDVREAAEFKSGHIAGARNIPGIDPQVAAKKLTKSKAKPVVFYGLASVHKMAQFALKVKQSGFSDVHILEGDLPAWNKEGYPLVTE